MTNLGEIRLWPCRHEIPVFEADKRQLSCNDSSNYRQRHMHHIITCQINSALKHLCCVLAVKQFKSRGVTVQGPRQEITYCPETQVPTNNLSSELEQDTTQYALLWYLQLCRTPNISIWLKQYRGNAVTTKVHPLLPLRSKKMLIFKVRTSSSPERSFYIKENCFFWFSVSSIKTNCCHCMDCTQDADGDGGCYARRVVANTLNMQSCTAEKRRSCSLGEE